VLGRQPISTKSVDASQYIKNRSMGAACTDLRRQTNLQKTPLQYGEKCDDKRAILQFYLIKYGGYRGID
jgi:hypothetical protein